MDSEIKAEWVKTLRSGEYTQGKQFLCGATSKFCCLGVLVDIQYDGFWERDPRGVWTADRMSTRLSDDLMMQVRLSAEHQDRLINMNDFGCTFAEIADWIEENL